MKKKWVSITLIIYLLGQSISIATDMYWTAKETSHKKYNSRFSLHLYNEIVNMCNDKIQVQW